jgi:hypothetical protein
MKSQLSPYGEFFGDMALGRLSKEISEAGIALVW